MVGWMLAQGMQWIIGFISVVMFAALCAGIGWMISFVFDYYARLFKRAKFQRRRRFNG